MHFSTVIVLKKFSSMYKRIPTVEVPYALYSLCIHAALIIWLVIERKVMSSSYEFKAIFSHFSQTKSTNSFGKCIMLLILYMKYCIIRSP